jgi:hypothetical protein
MAPQDALSLANAFVTLIKDSAPILYVLGVGFLLLLSWRRAGSAHFLLGRLWRLLGGDKEFADPYMNSQWKQLRDVEAMRFQTGIRFPSKTSATRTLAWLDLNEIALGDLIASKRFFDAENIVVRDPEYSRRADCGLAGIIALASLLFLLGIMNTFGEAFLTIKKSGTAFWTDGQVAMSWNRNGWELTKDDCMVRKSILDHSEDNRVICELLMSPPKTLVENSLKSQRQLNAGVMAVCMIAIFYIIGRLMSAKAAQKLYRKTHLLAS